MSPRWEVKDPWVLAGITFRRRQDEYVHRAETKWPFFSTYWVGQYGGYTIQIARTYDSIGGYGWTSRVHPIDEPEYDAVCPIGASRRAAPAVAKIKKIIKHSLMDTYIFRDFRAKIREDVGRCMTLEDLLDLLRERPVDCLNHGLILAHKCGPGPDYETALKLKIFLPSRWAFAKDTPVIEVFDAKVYRYDPRFSHAVKKLISRNTSPYSVTTLLKGVGIRYRCDVASSCDGKTQSHGSFSFDQDLLAPMFVYHRLMEDV